MTPLQQQIIDFIRTNPDSNLIDINSGVEGGFEVIMDAVIALKKEGIITRKHFGVSSYFEVSTCPEMDTIQTQ